MKSFGMLQGFTRGSGYTVTAEGIRIFETFSRINELTVSEIFDRLGVVRTFHF